MYDAGFLLIWLGVAAIFAGVLYGEIFGYHLIIGDHHGPLFANPMEEIVIVLKAAVLVGVVHISLGWILAMVNYIQKKQVFLAFAGPFMKILIIIGGTTLIFNYMFNIELWISPPYPILLPAIPTVLFMIIKPLGRIFGVSYLQKESLGEIMGELTIDVGETYLGILSNVASYSRILALAMAHMGLMLVITTIADIILEGGSTWLHFLFVSIVLILGNIFVIVMEALFAGIHALRLTFYEFFGKFFHADGIPYSFTEIDSDFSSLEFI